MSEPMMISELLPEYRTVTQAMDSVTSGLQREEISDDETETAQALL
jgi:hypothetical protein